MTHTLEEKIQLLEEFDVLLEREFNGQHDPEGRDTLRKRINQMAPVARSIITEAKCVKRMSLTPPSVVGGPVLSNVDPFNMIFEDYFGMSFIPTIRDSAQQAIGVLRVGGVQCSDGQQAEQRIVNKQLEMPDKVTLGWLAHNVPIRLWLIAGGLLVAAFTLGIKASTWQFVREIFSL